MILPILSTCAKEIILEMGLLPKQSFILQNDLRIKSVNDFNQMHLFFKSVMPILLRVIRVIFSYDVIVSGSYVFQNDPKQSDMLIYSSKNTICNMFSNI